MFPIKKNLTTKNFTMKIKSLILAGVFAIAGFSGNASNSSLFSYDKAAVNAKMNNVSAVETYVNQNDGVTVSSMNADGQQLVAAANLSEENSLSSSLLDGPVGVPSFLWGCVLGPLGILIVYLVTQDGDETKKSLYGCIVWGVWFFVLPFIMFGLIGIGGGFLWY